MEGCYLSAIERELDAYQLRGQAVQSFTPIQSFMFSHTGQLLFSTTSASERIKSRGRTKERSACVCACMPAKDGKCAMLACRGCLPSMLVNRP